MLSYLLARRGVCVTLLESQADFDRDFRGDTLMPAVMELLDDLELADKVMKLRHSKIQRISVQTEGVPQQVTDYGVLKTKYPYITVVPQADFLQLLVDHARSFPTFRLEMQANVREFLQEDGRICGVTYLTPEGPRECRAALVVGADGRFSRVRHLSGLKQVKTSPPMDVLWFRLPRLVDEPFDCNLSVRIGKGYYIAMTDRFDSWTISMVIPKGAYKELREAGIDSFRQSVVSVVPEFKDRLHALRDWSDIFYLQVISGRLTRWYRPGLLLIGDAAHTMSSVGGVGINYAIQDSVVASNLLAGPLRENRLELRHLAGVQWRRDWAVRLTQFLQRLAQRNVTSRALDSSRPFQLPLPLRIPWISKLAVYIGAFGVWPVRVDKTGFLPVVPTEPCRPT